MPLHVMKLDHGERCLCALDRWVPVLERCLCALDRWVPVLPPAARLTWVPVITFANDLLTGQPRDERGSRS